MAFERKIILVLTAFVAGATPTSYSHAHQKKGIVNVGSGPTWSNDILHIKGHYFGVLNHIGQNALPWKPYREIPRQTSTETSKITKDTTVYLAWKAKWLTAHDNTCGRQTYQPNFRRTKIIGGRIARKGSWPWMVSLVFEPFRQAVCAGAVIDKRWILTAAHCFDRPFFQDYSEMVVRVGIHNSSYFSEAATEQPRKISKVYKHWLYDGFGRNQRREPFIFDNDIALVKLDKALSYNDLVQPICLPKESEPNQRECVITGWGRQKAYTKLLQRSDSPYLTNGKACKYLVILVPTDSRNTSLDNSAWPQLLKQAVIPVITSQSCAMNTGYDDKVTKNMICAGYPEGKTDSCAGDSGGPLQCKSNGRWHLAGITSWGGASYSECAQPHQPGVYTDVYNFREWILCSLYEDAMKAKN